MKVVYSTCCDVDVHKTFFVATIIKTTRGVQFSYLKKRFSTFNSDIRYFKQCFLIIPVLMSVWNLLIDTGFLFLIFWRIRSMLPLLILNG